MVFFLLYGANWKKTIIMVTQIYNTWKKKLLMLFKSRYFWFRLLFKEIINEWRCLNNIIQVVHVLTCKQAHIWSIIIYKLFPAS